MCVNPRDPFGPQILRADCPAFLQWFWLNFLVDVWFMLDIALNFRTGYMAEGHFVSDDWLVAKAYLKGSFVVDCLGTFPLTSCGRRFGWRWWIPRCSTGRGISAPASARTAGTECAPASNPCRAAYINYCENNPAGCTAAAKGEGRNRFSWDPLTTLVAVRGASAAGNGVHECTDCDGHNVLNATSGDNEWHRGPNANQSYLVLDDGEKAGNALDSLLCQPPKLPHGAA